jgi:DNA-binding ferritin-like protein
MFVNENCKSNASSTAVVPAGDRFKTVAVLERLLLESIRLSWVHKSARWQISGSRLHKIRQMLDEHRKEQRSLIGLLIERIRTLSGAEPESVSESNRCTKVCRVIRGPLALDHLLRDLLEAHEAVLRAARPRDGYDDRVDVRDFAVGQVILTNEQQWEIISDSVLRAAPQQRLLETETSRLHEQE